ncbi:endonuclease/exonuclease/phosphatase family protein [Sphingobacterium humi]|nr:endonuclease/exonuclease/phosphatase family protein [Sphingobacterium humi]
MKAIKILWLLLLAVCLMPLGCASKKEAGQKKTIRVMSYNIHIASPPSIKPDFSFTDLDAVADVINREKADLVSLQEVDKYTARSGKQSHQSKDLGERTKMHDHFADAVDRSEGIQGNAILSKFPFVKTESFKLPVPANSKGETRSLALGVVNIEGKEVVFISVHLDHISDETRGYQVNQILGILEKYKDDPIIFTGDLNMQPGNQVLKVLEKYLIIANTSLPTFPSVRPDKTIDYILFNQKLLDNFEVGKFFTVDEKYASDHIPLVVDLTVK